LDVANETAGTNNSASKAPAAIRITTPGSYRLRLRRRDPSTE
jgi:hypothetical protein